MADVFLILVVLIFVVLLFLANLYVIAHYSHPLESNFGSSILSKIIVILAFSLCWAQVLMLPLDVSNTRGDAGLDMKSFWYTIYILIAIFVFLVLPFSLFFYETEGDEIRGRIWHAVKMQFFLMIIVSLILFLTFAFLSKAQIPVDTIVCSGTAASSGGGLIAESSDELSSGCSYGEGNIEINTSFPVYIMSILSFCGWFLFIVFGGIGLSALPLDFINDFRSRPVRLSQEEFANRRSGLLKQVVRLREVGKRLEGLKPSVDRAKGLKGWKTRRNFNKELTEFEAKCLIAEQKYMVLEKAANYSKAEPMLYALKLVLGVVGFIFSFFLILHIFLFQLVIVNGKPVHPFLNNMLDGMADSDAGFLATISFTLIALYLLWCAFKGNVKFGLRCFCFTFFPLVPNETFMNSFLFNALLINLWTVALIQFCSQIFAQYVRLTQVGLMFEVLVRHMLFYKWFFDNNVFPWLFVIWAVVTFIYMMLKPTERLRDEEELNKKDLEANRI